MRLRGVPPITLLQRGWYYFRVGNGGYLAFIQGFIQFLTVEYVLLISKISLLSWLHFWLFVILFTPSYSLLAIFTGRLHQKTQAYTDAAISSVSSPYLFKMFPIGKEPLLSMPMTLEQVDFMREFYRFIGKLTPERAKRLDDFERKTRNLIEGRDIRQDYPL